MKKSLARLALFLLAAALIAGCAGDRSSSPARQRDPLLLNYHRVLSWQSGAVNLRPPDEVNYAAAVEVASIQAELDAIRSVPCACGGSWGTIVHRPLRDIERPESSVYAEWVLACARCGALATRLFRVASPPADYDRFYSPPPPPPASRNE